MRIDAAILRELHQPFSIEPVDLDEPRAGEVLVRVAGTGLCHTDSMVRAMPPGTVPLPMVLGHEGSGVVESVGPGAVTVRSGDAVIMSFESCGHCGLCLAGAPPYCDQFNFLNASGRRPDGSCGARDSSTNEIGSRWFGQSSFATYAIATERNIVKVDGDVPLELMGPLGCGVQAGAASVLVEMGIRPGESIAIFGVGSVGLSAVMAAKVAGATTIIAIDLVSARRELAMEFGATHSFDGADPDIAELVKAASGGGVMYSFDTTGVPKVISAAVATLRARGFCGLVGISPEDIVLSPQALGGGRSISYLVAGGAVPQLFIPQLIDLWRAGRFPFDRLMQTYPLSEINAAEADLLSGRTVKPIVIPGRVT
jgi:aryl-alcohol dehydrogenase